MTPIEKNVSVVDEQGNEYEATYKKRAKGLVKNGRARFVSENRICLACPPNENSEDETMNNTIIISEKEIWEQIKATQNQMEELKKILFTVQCVQESGQYVPASEEDKENEHCGTPSEYSEDVALAKISAIKELVCVREQTLKTLLEFYISEYKEISSKRTQSNIVSRLDEISAWLKAQNRDGYDDEAWNAMPEAALLIFALTKNPALSCGIFLQFLFSVPRQ